MTQNPHLNHVFGAGSVGTSVPIATAKVRELIKRSRHWLHALLALLILSSVGQACFGQQLGNQSSSRFQAGRIGTPQFGGQASTQNTLRQSPGTMQAQLRQDQFVQPVGMARQEEVVTGESEEPVLESETLELADIVANVYGAFPLVEQARLERERTNGLITESFGSFDTKLQAFTLAEPTGFYRNYRHGISAARQSWWGTYLSAGYRVGRGEFQPWYLERETETGGEFKIGLGIPLLQGRAIDAQRLAVFQANLEREAADPFVQLTILNVSREAAQVYWEWVGSGAVLIAQDRLLQLALVRQEKFLRGFAAGAIKEIDVVLNRQLVAERRAKVIEAQQKFQSSAFKLSLFLRDEQGQPMVPNAEWVPLHFPSVTLVAERAFEEDLSSAMQRRPEPRQIEIELQQARVALQWAYNQTMPRVDVVLEASQDVGGPASKSDDKGIFRTVVGLQGEVPVQRRKARGKIQSTQAKIAQLNQKSRFIEDKLGAELQAAYNELKLAEELVAQQKLALNAALESYKRYRSAFENGSEKVNLIDLNQVESKANEVELKLIDSERKWLIALANMQAVLGLDPLEQAILLSNAPDSIRPELKVEEEMPR